MRPLYHERIVFTIGRFTSFAVCFLLVLLLGTARAQELVVTDLPLQPIVATTTLPSNPILNPTEIAKTKESTVPVTSTLTQSVPESSSFSSTLLPSSSTKLLVPEETPIISNEPTVLMSSKQIIPEKMNPVDSIPTVGVPTAKSRPLPAIRLNPSTSRRVQGAPSRTLLPPQTFPTPIRVASNPNNNLQSPFRPPSFIPAFPASFQIQNPSLSESLFENGVTPNEVESRDVKKVENLNLQTPKVEATWTTLPEAVQPTQMSPAVTQPNAPFKIQAASQDESSTELKPKEEPVTNSVPKSAYIGGTIAGCALLFASGAGGIYYFYSKRAKESASSTRRQSGHRRPSEEEQIHIVHIPYVPELEDELKLSVGDQVIIQERFQDKWVLGTNLTTGDSGCFPILCLDEDAASSIPSEFGSMYSMDRNTMSDIHSQRSHSLNLRNSSSTGYTTSVMERDTHLM